MQWTVEQTKTQDVDLRIIQGHYPWAVKTHLGEHIALVKSQSTAKTGFAKAAEVNERDEGFKIAELISAAPELYAVVESFLESWKTEESPNMVIIGDAYRALRKAKPD